MNLLLTAHAIDRAQDRWGFALREEAERALREVVARGRCLRTRTRAGKSVRLLDGVGAVICKRDPRVGGLVVVTAITCEEAEAQSKRNPDGRRRKGSRKRSRRW
jgi:hypothetical protein